MMLLDQLASHGGTVDWTMPPAEALDVFTEKVEKKVAASPRWPKTPALLGSELRRIAPQLREHGLFVIFRRTYQSRLLTITTKPRSDYSGDMT